MQIGMSGGGASPAAIWLNGTRTLTSDPASDAGAGTIVWGHTIRQITSMNPAIQSGHNLAYSLASATKYQLGFGSLFSMWSLSTMSAANVTMGLYDGSTWVTVQGAGANGITLVGDGTACPGFFNNDGSAHNVAWSGIYTLAQ